MASRQATVDFIVDQLAPAGVIATKRMFGEYCIYCKGKVVAFVCDDQLFVKPTAAGKAYAGGIGEGAPYPGAKNYILVPGDKWEDGEWLAGLVRVSWPELPAAKPKSAKKKSPRLLVR